MKNNLKNANAIQRILLLHAEKAVMLVAVLLAGWLVYGSLSPESEQRKPGDLGNMVSQTRRTIGEFSAADAPSPAEDPQNAIKQADSFQLATERTVDVQDYQSGLVWGQPVVPKVNMRTDPLLLPATELEGIGMTTLLATQDPEIARQRMMEELEAEQQRNFEREQERLREREQDEPGRRGAGATGRGRGGPAPALRGGRRGGGASQMNGDERIDLVSFAAVTALVPVSDQMKLYLDAFENARGYSAARDVPQWLGYYIERAEIASGVAPKWTPVTLEDRSARNRGKRLPYVSGPVIQRATSDWVTLNETLVDRRYWDDNLTFPLPPIIGQTFGREIVHSKVPLQVETDAALENEQEVIEQPVAGPDDLLAAGDTARLGGRGGDRMGGRGTPYAGARSRGRGIPGEGGRGMGGRLGAGTQRMTDYAMLRFFDFSVEAGKRYRYRVRLIMKDPNNSRPTASNRVELNTLAREVKQRVEENPKKYNRLSEWSEPSRIISIPAAGEVLVATIEPPSRSKPNSEPQANLLLKTYDVDGTNRAIQAEKILSFSRGSVLNRTEKDVEALKGNQVETMESFTFKTDVVLLDIAGGGEVNRETKAPGRVLLMDASGKLHVTDEISSLPAVQMHQMAQEAGNGRGPGRGRAPAGRGDGGGRGGRGGFNLEF